MVLFKLKIRYFFFHSKTTQCKGVGWKLQTCLNAAVLRIPLSEPKTITGQPRIFYAWDQQCDHDWGKLLQLTCWAFFFPSLMWKIKGLIQWHRDNRKAPGTFNKLLQYRFILLSINIFILTWSDVFNENLSDTFASVLQGQWTASLVSLTDSTNLALVWEDEELWRCYVLFYIKVCEYTEEFKFVTFVKGVNIKKGTYELLYSGSE